MAGALHLLPVFLLCGYFTLISAGDVPAADVASTTTRSLSSSAPTEAPTSADNTRTSSKPGKSNTIAEHLGGK